MRSLLLPLFVLMAISAIVVRGCVMPHCPPDVINEAGKDKLHDLETTLLDTANEEFGRYMELRDDPDTIAQRKAESRALALKRQPAAINLVRMLRDPELGRLYDSRGIEADIIEMKFFTFYGYHLFDEISSNEELVKKEDEAVPDREELRPVKEGEEPIHVPDKVVFREDL